MRHKSKCKRGDRAPQLQLANSPGVTSVPGPTPSSLNLQAAASASPIPQPIPIVEMYNGLTEADLRHSVARLGTDGKSITKCLAKRMFSVEQLITCSVTGKRTGKCGDAPRPPLSAVYLAKLQDLVRELSPQYPRRDVLESINNVMKVLRFKKKLNSC